MGTVHTVLQFIQFIQFYSSYKKAQTGPITSTSCSLLHISSMKGLVNYHAKDDAENYEKHLDEEKNEILPKIKRVEVTLHDQRDVNNFRFSEHGLEMDIFPSELDKIADVMDDISKEIYEKELAEILNRKLDNIKEVFVFDHTIRSTKTTTRKVAKHVHVDYTDASAVQRMKDMLGEERAGEWLEDGGHVGIVNVWRPLDFPVERDPLGFIDPATVGPEDWHTVSTFTQGGRVGVIQGVEHREDHRWVVLDKMDTNMVWIFNQFDSKGLRGVPHSAVEVVGTKEDARPRRSIDSRILIRYKE